MMTSSTTKRSFNDLDLSEYDENGEVKQLLYAHNHVRNSPPVVFFMVPSENTTVILAAHQSKNRLLTGFHHFRRIHHFKDSHLVAAIVGYHSDNNAVVQYIHEALISYQFRYGSYPSVFNLANKIGRYLVRALYTSEEDEDDGNDQERVNRPMACDALLLSIKDQRAIHVQNAGCTQNIYGGHSSSGDRIISGIIGKTGSSLTEVQLHNILHDSSLGTKGKLKNILEELENCGYDLFEALIVRGSGSSSQVQYIPVSKVIDETYLS